MTVDLGFAHHQCLYTCYCLAASTHPGPQRNWPPADCRQCPGTCSGDSVAELLTLRIIFQSDQRVWSAKLSLYGFKKIHK